MTEHRVRKMFFWFLVLIFLTIAPLAILYSMGYRFSSERGIFIYSGSITLKPSPRKIKVYIDKKKVPKGIINFVNYSYHIDGLLPGEHSLEVRANGYYPWRKEAYVHSGVSTEFWNVFLVQEKYLQTKYETAGVESFFISPDNKRIAVVNNSPTATVQILNIKKEVIEYTFSFDEETFATSEKENVEWSPKEGRLIVPLKKEKQRHYFIINIGTQETLNLNKIVKEETLKQARWSSGEKNTVFYIAQDILYKVNLSKPEEKIIIAENVVGYDFSGNNIYYLSKNNGIIYREKLAGQEIAEQISSQSLEIKTGEDFRIIVYDKEQIAIISQDKSLYLYDEKNENQKINKIANFVSGLHFSNDGKKLVFWNNNEIFVYFTREWDTQPYRQKGQLTNIVRFSKKIKNVSWFNDYEHLIFTVGKTIKLAELGHRSHRNIYDLIQLNIINSKIVYTTNKDRIFFVNTADENFNQKELYSISLTEKEKK